MSYLFCFIIFYGFLIFSSSYSLLILLIISLYLFFSSYCLLYCRHEFKYTLGKVIGSPDPQYCKKKFLCYSKFSGDVWSAKYFIARSALPSHVAHARTARIPQERRNAFSGSPVFFPFQIPGPVSEFIADIRIRIKVSK